jgi:hypothetical protein
VVGWWVFWGGVRGQVEQHIAAADARQVKNRHSSKMQGMLMQGLQQTAQQLKRYQQVAQLVMSLLTDLLPTVGRCVCICLAAVGLPWPPG